MNPPQTRRGLVQLSIETEGVCSEPPFEPKAVWFKPPFNLEGVGARAPATPPLQKQFNVNFGRERRPHFLGEEEVKKKKNKGQKTQGEQAIKEKGNTHTRAATQKKEGTDPSLSSSQKQRTKSTSTSGGGKGGDQLLGKEGVKSNDRFYSKVFFFLNPPKIGVQSPRSTTR